jgi:hypothetical protein
MTTLATFIVAIYCAISIGYVIMTHRLHRRIKVTRKQQAVAYIAWGLLWPVMGLIALHTGLDEEFGK